MEACALHKPEIESASRELFDLTGAFNTGIGQV